MEPCAVAMAAPPRKTTGAPGKKDTVGLGALAVLVIGLGIIVYLAVPKDSDRAAATGDQAAPKPEDQAAAKADDKSKDDSQLQTVTITAEHSKTSLQRTADSVSVRTTLPV